MTLQQLLGIQLPIIQAPMAGVQGAALAVAVSNAGGLGSLPCARLTTESLRTELEAIRDQTNRPFNVNFFCHAKPARDVERERTWLRMLQPYFDELGIDPESIAQDPARTPFNSHLAEIVEPFRPPVVSFHFGLPSPDLVTRVRTWGSKILASATTVDEALWLQDRGVDAIVAQGWEAGGHRGMFLSDDVATQTGTFALVPQIAKTVTVPVIAAGGITESSGVSAALALGAAGVQVGTAYLLCREATTSSVHRAALKGDGARTTAVTNVFTGRPARGIVNRVMREIGYMSTHAPAFPLASLPMAALRAAAEKKGNADFSPLWCGQNASGCREVPAAVLTQELASNTQLDS